MQLSSFLVPKEDQRQRPLFPDTTPTYSPSKAGYAPQLFENHENYPLTETTRTIIGQRHLAWLNVSAPVIREELVHAFVGAISAVVFLAAGIYCYTNNITLCEIFGRTKARKGRKRCPAAPRGE